MCIIERLFKVSLSSAVRFLNNLKLYAKGFGITSHLGWQQKYVHYSLDHLVFGYIHHLEAPYNHLIFFSSGLVVIFEKKNERNGPCAFLQCF